MKTVLTWAGIIIAVMWVVKDPTGAANVVHGITHFLSQAAAALGTLANSL
jgi:hypothetical protein